MRAKALLAWSGSIAVQLACAAPARGDAMVLGSVRLASLDSAAAFLARIYDRLGVGDMIDATRLRGSLARSVPPDVRSLVDPLGPCGWLFLVDSRGVVETAFAGSLVAGADADAAFILRDGDRGIVSAAGRDESRARAARWLARSASRAPVAVAADAEVFRRSLEPLLRARILALEATAGLASLLGEEPEVDPRVARALDAVLDLTRPWSRIAAELEWVGSTCEIDLSLGVPADSELARRLSKLPDDCPELPGAPGGSSGLACAGDRAAWQDILALLGVGWWMGRASMTESDGALVFGSDRGRSPRAGHDPDRAARAGSRRVLGRARFSLARLARSACGSAGTQIMFPGADSAPSTSELEAMWDGAAVLVSLRISGEDLRSSTPVWNVR